MFPTKKLVWLKRQQADASRLELWEMNGGDAAQQLTVIDLQF